MSFRGRPCRGEKIVDINGHAYNFALRIHADSCDRLGKIIIFAALGRLFATGREDDFYPASASECLRAGHLTGSPDDLRWRA